jgi:Spy/CpxP family protein refolding chaperone
MSKPMKTILLTVTTCTVIAFASVASVNASPCVSFFDGQRGDGQGYIHQENKHKMKRMVKALSLTKQQQEQIKTIKIKASEQGKALKLSMIDFRAGRKELIHAKSFDENAFKALQDKYQVTFSQFALIRAKTKHAVFNVLTTEQQDKWLKIIEQKKSKRNARRRDA